MKLEPVAWALYWKEGDLCDIVTAKRLADGWLTRNANATACKPFVAPLYAIPPGYVLVPVRLLEEIMQSLDGTPMSMRSRGDARIAKDVSALIEGEQC